MSISNPLRDNLKQLVDVESIITDNRREHYQIDGFSPQAIISPSFVQEIQDVLAFAANRKLSVIPAGSGTKLGIGNLPEKVDLVLAMARFNEVLEYEPADLTVTVQAGIRLADLQTKLAENGQFLPFDPPYAERTTVGGIVAANASGPSRLRYGTARNRVLGMRIVQSNGVIVKSGGKVVKNVAGYDFKKLYIGSLGTLGIITELTFSLQPLPETERTLILTFKEVGPAAKAASEIANSQLLPVFLNLFSNGVPSTTFSGTILAMGVDGYPETVAWQIDQVKSLAKQNGVISVKVIEDADQHDFRTAVRAFPEGRWSSQVIICKANLRMTDVVNFSNTAIEIIRGLHYSVHMMGLMGNGVVYITISEFPNDADKLQSIAETITKLRKHAISMGGNLIIESAPIEIKRQIDVWGTAGNSIGLMKQIKAKLDPIGMLNPGRFVEGI